MTNLRRMECTGGLVTVDRTLEWWKATRVVDDGLLGPQFAEMTMMSVDCC